MSAEFIPIPVPVIAHTLHSTIFMFTCIVRLACSTLVYDFMNLIFSIYEDFSVDYSSRTSCSNWHYVG